MKKSFRENLLQKIELEGLASKVIASIGPEHASRSINREAMKKLLEMSPYQHRHERDLDLYIKDGGEENSILVLDNELPVFRSTVKDVTTRRSPRTLEMWKISTIRKILVDSDIKESTGEESVQTVLQDAVARLDLSFTEADIDDLARDGMAWLAGKEARGVEETLSMFATLLGYRPPPKSFGLDQVISYGKTVPGTGKEVVFGPLVLYRPEDNTLLWLDKIFSQSDREQMKLLRSIAAARSAAPVKGDAVFEKLKNMVLEQAGQVRARLAGSLKD